MTLTEWVDSHLANAPMLEQAELWKRAARPNVPGLFCEFGVGKGDSLRKFAAIRPDVVWYGFDWFHGLPEAGPRSLWPKGAYSTQGQAPHGLPENTRIWVGLFEGSIPEFLLAHFNQAAFLHIDCDLYESTKTILALMGPRFTAGTHLLFDEFRNFPGWEDGEAKAFYEFCTQSDIQVECLGVEDEKALFRVKGRKS